MTTREENTMNEPEKIAIVMDGKPLAEKTADQTMDTPPTARSRKTSARFKPPTRKDLTAVERTRVYPLFLLDNIFPENVRHNAVLILGAFLALVFFFLTISFLFSLSPENALSLVISYDLATAATPKLLGLFFILLSFWLTVYALEAFYRSLYYYNRDAVFQRSSEPVMVSEAARMFYDARGGDILASFLHSYLGAATLLRLGIPIEDTEKFLDERQEIRSVTFLEARDSGVSTVLDLGVYLYDTDEAFSQFLFRHGARKEDFLASLQWMRRMDNERKFKARWWSRSNLERIPGIGKDWAYGGAYVLERYSRTIAPERDFVYGATEHSIRRKKIVDQIETILSKKREANALLVGDPGVGKEDILAEFSERVTRGTVPPVLEGKRVLLLDVNLLIAGTREKGEFENQFLRVMDDAVRAGNIILVLNNFPELMQSARELGSDIVSLLDPYLSSDILQVIALSDKDKFHQFLETDAAITSRFDTVLVEEPGLESVIEVLEDTAVMIEAWENIYFTYPAIVEIARDADNYIVDGVMPDKAVDLMVAIAPVVVQQGREFVVREDVQEYVRTKTHIPVGNIDEEEREQLSHLEDILHKKVIGQDKAIDALANALRRSRAGIRDPKRPIGSFLFLGPTGVGKTQTAKAVAEIFFGSGEAMSRVDMSEYSGPDALKRMIGSFETGEIGALTRLFKQRPYGVVLLDEFEKGSRHVHDLFLQVLDEGFFSDARGKKVNARNAIFIATSNAGSDMIWEASERGEDVSALKDTLIHYVIEKGIYRPEFLNRFDDVIVFHPLSQEHLRSIAAIMLKDLAKRVKQQGYELVINDALIDKTIEAGYDPAFGARPMSRAIKDIIEQAIAKKIISGTLRIGDTLELTEADLV